MTARRTVLLTGVVLGAVLLALAVPVASGVYPVAQLVSFRAILGLGSLAAALLLVVVPGTRRTLLPLVLAFTVGAVAQAAVLGWRAVPHERAAAPGPDAVVVLSFNTLDTVPAQELFALVDEHDADVVSLPETSVHTGRKVAALMAQTGRPMRVYTGKGSAPSVAATTLLVSERLGAYGDAEELPTHFGSLRVEPAEPGLSPVLVAAHPISPGARSVMQAWRDDTRLIAQECASTPGAIVAGDLNATLDHPGLRALGPCVDAAQQAGQAWRGTWPSSAPSLLAAPIDHVLVDGRAWRVVTFQVLPATGGSDHRPIVVTLAPR